MADVKWIKMSTGLPDNRKIKQIRNLPNGDSIALMWVFMLCLAGSVNEQGLIYITPEVPYTDEMLAEEFNMDLNTVRLGLATFQRFGMIEIVEDVIFLSAWEKWQSVDRLSEMREYNRLAKQKSRAKQKLLASVNDMSMTGQRCQDTDKIREDKKENRKEDNKPVRHKYGEYKNVLLSDEQYEKLVKEFPDDYQERIERLSEWMASTGTARKDHLATIRSWARREKNDVKGIQNGSNSKPVKQNRFGYNFEQDNI